MQIPDSFSKTLERRLARLVASIDPEPSDYRTRDLLRLVRKDLCRLRRYISKTEDDEKDRQVQTKARGAGGQTEQHGKSR